MSALGAVDITVIVFGGVYIVCAWLSVAIYQSQVKKNKDRLFENMDKQEPEPERKSSGPSIVTSGPMTTEPSEEKPVTPYQSSVKSGSEFPSIQVSSSTEKPETSDTTTGQTDSVPSYDSQVSGFWGSQGSQEPKSITTSSTGDTNSLESNNSDVSGFWSSKGGKGDQPKGESKTQGSGLSDTTSGNTPSESSANSQVSGFWESGGGGGGEKEASGGDAPKNKSNQQASQKQKDKDNESKDDSFWDGDSNSKGDSLDDYQTLDNSSVGDKTMEVKSVKN